MATTALPVESQWDFSNLAFLMKDLVVSGSVFIGGNGMSSTELGFLDSVTAGTAAASKALVLDSSLNLATVHNLTMNGTLLFSGLTTANIVSLTDNLADALNFKESSNSYLKFVTTDSSESVAVGKAATFASTVAVTGVTTPTGGIAAAGGYAVTPRNMHTGGNPPSVSTDFSDYTVVVTETIRAEVFVPANTSCTGVALFNGSSVAGNVVAYLIDSTGAQIGSFKTASTAASGTDAFQRIPWSGGPYALTGPATYWVAVQGNNTGMKANTHTIGNFGADKQTGTVFNTLTVATAPTTFTTALGPVASLY